MGIQAERVFNMRLVAAYMCEWNLAAKGGFCKEFEPRHEKTNVLVSDLVRHKPGCTATKDG